MQMVYGSDSAESEMIIINIMIVNKNIAHAIKMTVFVIVFVCCAIGFASCVRQPVASDYPASSEQMSEVKESATAKCHQMIDECVDFTDCFDTIIDSIRLRIYIPYYSRIEFYTGPEIAELDQYSNCIYLAAAAFTGKGYQNGFDHKLIAGNHVEDNHAYPYKSTLYHGYSCARNTGAFVDYNGKYAFLYREYSAELEMAAANGGVGFAQEMIIHHSLQVPTTRPLSNVNVFRTLCERNNQLCIIESVRPLEFGVFIDALLKLNVVEALYLDMGDWSFSWYRNINGEVVYSFPNNRQLLTNAIVFTGVN